MKDLDTLDKDELYGLYRWQQEQINLMMESIALLMRAECIRLERAKAKNGT